MRQKIIVACALFVSSISTLVSANKESHSKGIISSGLRKLQQMAYKADARPYVRAGIAAKNFEETRKKLDISRKSYFDAAVFIEQQKVQHPHNKKTFFAKGTTQLEYNITYDRTTKRYFIQLQDKPQFFVGVGKKKRVVKSIMYDQKKARIVACAIQNVVQKKEVTITKVLAGTPGIFPVFGYGEYNKGGKKKHCFYSKVYSPGSLDVALNKESFRLSEKTKIALNILQGLDSMHSRGIVHCDIAAENILIDIPSGEKGRRQIQTVIADLGRAYYAKNIAYSKLQGHSRYTAPEILIKNLKCAEYYATDVYATGLVLYWLFNGTRAPWQEKTHRNPISSLNSVSYKELVKKINHHTASDRSALEAKSMTTQLTAKEEFKLLILQMIHPDPERRPKAFDLVARMLKISSMCEVR